MLDGLDLTVGVGTRLLVVSEPEGSASLLLRVLAGLARPSSGTLRLAGLARGDDSAAGWARRVSYAGSDQALYPWMSAREVLELALRLAGHEAEERDARMEAVVNRFHLRGELDQPFSRSGPQVAQRTLLAAALIGEPEIVLLDDPLRSLEPNERARLLHLPGKRRTLLLASRYPASEAGLVTRVALLRHGRLALDAPIEELERHGLPLSARGISALADLADTAAALAPPA
ncbi:MAG TPA: ATP-binding cassette domain-containing protein [Candidatus Limnocylindria bacterium]